VPDVREDLYVCGGLERVERVEASLVQHVQPIAEEIGPSCPDSRVSTDNDSVNRGRAEEVIGVGLEDRVRFRIRNEERTGSYCHGTWFTDQSFERFKYERRTGPQLDLDAISRHRFDTRDVIEDGTHVVLGEARSESSGDDIGRNWGAVVKLQTWPNLDHKRLSIRCHRQSLSKPRLYPAILTDFRKGFYRQILGELGEFYLSHSQS
jgi:hypothetical protein